MTRFPNKELACSVITAHIAESLGFSNRKDIYKYYNGRGSFFLPKYIDFDNHFLSQINNKQLIHFPKNDLESDLPISGEAVLSKSTIAKGDSKGKNQYKGSNFDTGHILGHSLIGNIESYDSSRSNSKNIFPQSDWANEGTFSLSSNVGVNQTAIEQLIRTKIQSKKSPEDIMVYYKVNLIYGSNERVPRFIHIQAVSNYPSIIRNQNVLIPNVTNSYEIDYHFWYSSKNMKNAVSHE
ncbi:DNA/RNA non-specific endonuclease [Streptococcus anginosus]|uniref:DNA/RNA non-specific endonuclease n=1 Tax=Streptococcus anginosus TaxID=1328 RepID=UPI00195E1EE7|nr:DNA/RNA non-specific endonuclease [Streptococcus anginosus]VTY29493.1 DNA-entry nuclease [Streptococcus anginosus]